jgi:hypothetical protein
MITMNQIFNREHIEKEICEILGNFEKNHKNTNFKKGLIYIKYNSLPSDENGEITIPIITTGDILRYITNYVKIQIAENLILNVFAAFIHCDAIYS